MQNKKSKLKKIALFSFYGIITVAVLCVFLGANDFGAILGELGNADIKYVLIALALLLLYAFLSPLTTCILVRAKRLETGLITAYSVSMTEHFFNGITPFSTGGQPFQVYEFARGGVKAADSTGVLLLNFIITMIITNIFAACSLIYYNRFIGGNASMMIIAAIGFSMNFLVLLFMIALATSKSLKKLIFRLAEGLCRIKFLEKLLSPKLEQFNSYLDNVQSAFFFLVKRKGTFTLCLAVRAATMAIYYAITFYVLRALHIEVGYGDMFFIMCGSSFAITAVVFLPTPGASGGIEFAFKNVFVSLSGGALAPSVAYGGMLIWRLLTYYLLMALSIAFYVGLEIYFALAAKKRAVQIGFKSEQNTIAPVICLNENNFDGIDAQNSSPENQSYAQDVKTAMRGDAREIKLIAQNGTEDGKTVKGKEDAML